MITQKQFKELQKFRIGSFAIWNPEGIHNADYFKKNIKKLHGNVIFLGLNRSGDPKNPNPVYKNKEYGFSNFHSKKNHGDKNLEKMFKNNKLKYLNGAFMTDLYDDVNSDSSDIDRKYLNNSSLILKYFIRVYNQIKILRKNNFYIICFGGQVFKHISKILLNNEKPTKINENIKYFKSEFPYKNRKVVINVYRVWHYSNYGRYSNKIEELKKQLIFLNSKIKN